MSQPVALCVDCMLLPPEYHTCNQCKLHALMLTAGAEQLSELARTLPLDSSSIQDQETPDDTAMATVPESAAASAAAEAYTAGGAARQATLQKLQSLQSRLAQVNYHSNT